MHGQSNLKSIINLLNFSVAKLLTCNLSFTLFHRDMDTQAHTHAHTHTHTLQTIHTYMYYTHFICIIVMCITKTFHITYHGSSYSQYEYISRYDITYIITCKS